MCSSLMMMKVMVVMMMKMMWLMCFRFLCPRPSKSSSDCSFTANKV